MKPAIFLLMTQAMQARPNRTATATEAASSLLILQQGKVAEAWCGQGAAAAGGGGSGNGQEAAHVNRKRPVLLLQSLPTCCDAREQPGRQGGHKGGK